MRNCLRTTAVHLAVLMFFGSACYSQQDKNRGEKKDSRKLQLKTNKKKLTLRRKPTLKKQAADEPLGNKADAADGQPEPDVAPGGNALDGVAPVASPVKRLPRKTNNYLETIVFPAYVNGQIDVFYNSMLSVLQGMGPKQFEALELLGKKHGIGSVNSAFVKRRMELIEQDAKRGIQAKLPLFRLAGSQKWIYSPQLVSDNPPNLELAIYIATGMQKRIEDELADMRDHASMREPLTLPKSWREKELVFWDTHVFKNRLQNMSRLAEHAIQITGNHFANALKNGDDANAARLRPIQSIYQSVESQYYQLLENEAVLRLKDLTIAEKTIRTGTDFKNRLYAAYALQDHAGSLDQFAATFPSHRITHDALKDPSTAERIRELYELGQEHGKDVLAKSLLLRVGAHWWMRGRYGSGTMAAGLLKSHEAVKSPAAMFGLYMPKKRPKPITKYLGNELSSPGYDRRHFYTWAVEYRPLVSGTRSKTTRSPIDWGKQTQFSDTFY